ncbi:pentapeptide repeat-containing protein, partial [bacterium]|nr:pentapeptide repeat-containing protein [bacterium]
MFGKRKRQKKIILQKIKDRINVDKLAFKNMDLKRMKFQGLDLSGIDFSGSDLRECKFSKCNLTDTSFREAKLEFAVFDGGTLHNANLESANLNNGNFNNCSIEKANLKNSQGKQATFVNSSIKETSLENADFSCSTIEECKFDGVRAKGSRFDEAVICKTFFLDSDFSHSDFTAATWEKNQFENVLFTNAIARNIEIYKSQFVKVNFLNANFKRVWGLPKDLREEIVNQKGLVSPQYFKLLWQNIYGRIGVIVLLVVVAFGLIDIFINPLHWSNDKIVNKAQQLMKVGQVQKAEMILRKGLRGRRSDNNAGQLKILLGNMYHQMGNFDKEKDMYEEVANLSGGSGYEARIYLAQLCEAEDKLEEAMRRYRELREI